MPEPINDNKEDTNQNAYILLNVVEYYKILGIDIKATKEDVTRSYKELLKIWDPSRFRNEPELQNKATLKIREIDRAYENVLYYMTNPQFQYHPFSFSNATQKSKAEDIDKNTQILSNQTKKKISTTHFTLKEIKSVASLPNLFFLSYVFMVFALQLRHYEIFSVYFIPIIFKRSIVYLIPPFIGWLFFNLTKSEVKIYKIISLGLTSLFLLSFVFLNQGIYQNIFAYGNDEKEATSPVTLDASLAQKGSELTAANKYNEAIGAYSKAIKLNPFNADYFYCRSIAYSLTNKDKEFLRDCRTAARMGHLEAIKTLNSLDTRY